MQTSAGTGGHTGQAKTSRAPSTKATCLQSDGAHTCMSTHGASCCAGECTHAAGAPSAAAFARATTGPAQQRSKSKTTLEACAGRSLNHATKQTTSATRLQRRAQTKAKATHRYQTSFEHDSRCNRSKMVPRSVDLCAGCGISRNKQMMLTRVPRELP
jgi:hypothetical protein